MTKLKKGAYCTDIHFGKKANSQTHNEDCLNYLEWFCGNVESDPTIDYVAFLGDWNENRSALNIQTLNYSYKGAKMLNNLNLPIFFVIGNHDLYHRHTRDVHSVIPFVEFDNFILIDQPIIVETIHDTVLFCPYMFHDEYPDLKKYLHIPYWAGHFEFKGFVVTGYNVRMPTGPDPRDYKGPEHIVSGHFHKRQAHEQVVYIGNTFPMDFGDAGDNDRGMMVYDHVKKDMLFHNWEVCPKYIKTTLSDIIDKNVTMYPQSRVKCLVDIPVTFEESTYLRSKFVEKYDLREFQMEESPEIANALTETETSVEPGKLESVNELVVKMLMDIDSEHINNKLLVDIYKELKV
ncbi:hypothetical protein LCGC14_1915530 [marine sediment metagenome]|uniref:Calcineurin-like phosphoesterase domain-containing protein n=1 Tax=marine sediment metagenome TaxID=412755 RepID=A0A0F9GFN3_9ZZZZ